MSELKCPDCGHRFQAKPEVVIQREPCKCGDSTEARVARAFSYAVMVIFLSFFGGCWATAHYSAQIAKKGQELGPFNQLIDAPKKIEEKK